MADLNDEQKTFIVQRLACFDSYQEVATAVSEAFAISVDRQQVYKYDPTRPAYDKAAAWKAIFDETRKAFLEDTASIGIAHKSVRLRKLDEMLGQAIRMKNLALAAQLMEQAAKETGNAYTNRRELTGKDGKDLPSPHIVVEYVEGAGADPSGSSGL